MEIQASVRIYVLLNVAKARRSFIENFRGSMCCRFCQSHPMEKGYYAENPKLKPLQKSQLWKKCMQRMLNLKPQKENVMGIKNTTVHEASISCALPPESFLLWLI